MPLSSSSFAFVRLPASSWLWRCLLLHCLLSSLPVLPPLSFPLLPVVSGGANFTLFDSAACNVSYGEEAVVDFPSSPKCQAADPLTVPLVSFVLDCGPVGGAANATSLAFFVWNGSGDCEGDATFSVQAEGSTGACVRADVTVGGEALQLHSRLACGDGRGREDEREGAQDAEAKSSATSALPPPPQVQ